MNIHFEKNRLDLAYQRQLYYLNRVIALATIGFISFLGTFIWNKEKLLIGFIILTTLSLISYAWHKQINKKLKEISENIQKLSK